MENTRSYLSRFSGLGLFIVALLIVGVLVWLTVQSADDNNDTTANETTNEQQDNRSGADEPDENIFSDENEDADNNADEDATNDGTVAGTDDQLSEGNLPNTGPESTIAAFIGVVAVTWTILHYRRSTRELNRSLR